MAAESTGRSGGTPPEDADANGGEYRGGPRMGTTVISGATFTNKSVVYYDVEGVAIVEGDIALGTVEDVEQATAAAREAVVDDPNIAFSVGLSGSQFRWPNCVIPFEIDPNLPNQQRVTDAIAHWEANTAFRFPQRTPANASQHPNYVRFTDAGGCWARVGMQGGEQTISLGPNCTTGNTIHEIGHTVGLWHEQSREDRDLFVTINWEHIQDGMAAQFNQHIVDGDDLGTYDYGSIMHYPRNAFSKDGQDTITPTDPNAQIGQRTGLSAGDLGGVRAMYPGCAVKQPSAEPIKKLRDDRPPFKKLTDEGPPFKKIRDDVIGKQIRDPKLPRDPGPIKGAFDPMPIGRPGGVTQPGTLLPFSMATPHHAPMAQESAAGETDLASYVSELEQQLLDLEATIAEANATAAQSHANIARLQAARDAVASAYEEVLRQIGGPT